MTEFRQVGDGSADPSRIAEFFSAQMGTGAGSLPCWKALSCCTSCNVSPPSETYTSYALFPYQITPKPEIPRIFKIYLLGF